MGRVSFIRVLLLFALLSLSVSHGFGRKVLIEVGDSWVEPEESQGKSREMIEILDYNLDPEPNTNPRTGFNGPPPRG